MFSASTKVALSRIILKIYVVLGAGFLFLLGTGVLGLAGVVRRKVRT